METSFNKDLERGQRIEKEILVEVKKKYDDAYLVDDSNENFNSTCMSDEDYSDCSGRIIFELDGVSEEVAREALMRAKAKLPFDAKFVTRIEG